MNQFCLPLLRQSCISQLRGEKEQQVLTQLNTIKLKAPQGRRCRSGGKDRWPKGRILATFRLMVFAGLVESQYTLNGACLVCFVGGNDKCPASRKFSLVKYPLGVVRDRCRKVCLCVILSVFSLPWTSWNCACAVILQVTENGRMYIGDLVAPTLYVY